MRILLLCDDYYHPGKVPMDGIVPLKEKGFEFDIITDAKEFKPEMLSDYPVVMICKSDEVSQEDKQPWKTAAVQKAFIDYVEKGSGLLVAHSGTVAGKNTEALDKLIGCRFSYHPEETPVTVQPIKPHPIVEGVGMFCEADEHYRLEIIADDVDIIMASYSPSQGVQAKYEEEPYTNSPEWISPAGYVRKQGAGRVCVLTPGHNLPVWHNPNYQKVLENALRWCAK